MFILDDFVGRWQWWRRWRGGRWHYNQQWGWIRDEKHREFPSSEGVEDYRVLVNR